MNISDEYNIPDDKTFQKLFYLAQAQLAVKDEKRYFKIGGKIDFALSLLWALQVKQAQASIPTAL